jgi:micrococcal nuclease
MKTSKKLKTTFACLFVGILLAGTSSKTLAQTISTDSVANYIGKTVKVCDKVYGTHVSKGEKKVSSLNLGADFPNQKLTVVIFESDLAKFSYTPTVFLKDKNVCVTGKIMTYKEKPQIIINEPTDLTFE